MKNYVLLLFCSFIPFVINAQEGFWSIDQIPQVQEKLQAAGLAFPLEKLTNAKHDGLANAVIRFDYGNAVFLNAQGLAFGLLSPSVVPDSIWPLMEANHGVWLAQSGQEIPLKGFPAEVYVNSKPLKDQRLEPGQAFFFTSYETQPDGSSYAVETHLAGAQSTQVVEQRYKRYTALQLIGVIQLPVEGAREQQIGVLLRMHTSPEKAQNAETPAGTTPYIPLGKHEINQPNHVVLGHPRGSSIHRLGFELDVALELAKCHQDLDRALGAYVTRPPFITEDGVF
ncbi:MAG TPA: S46 family peptidase, partial [Haliscomenobacter sp.]|nr:S46 family peptidase [Haliscomenobacter sp.]